jgi:histidinol-phosphate aminotransferase
MRFIRALGDIVPYEPGAPIELVMRRYGLDEVVKLASNEFPQPPFDEVQAAIVAALSELNRYPDGNATDLRAALAAHYGRSPDQVAVGNGSCELLMLLGDALLERDDEVVFAEPSFVVYEDICVRHQARGVAVPLADFAHDLTAMAAAVTPRTKMLIVCNPNNPTGTYVPAAAVAELLRAVPDDVLVVLDEAYNEFVKAADWQDTLALQAEHRNVIILRTFSKIYGLCGLRVGYGLCDETLRQAIDKVRQPFNVNRLAQVAALEALRHQDQVLERRAQNSRLRDYMVAALGSLGRAIVPSEANFMLVSIEDLCHPQDQVCAALMQLGAIVRDGNALGCPGWARVSVGTRQEIDFFLERLASLEQIPVSEGGEQ